MSVKVPVATAAMDFSDDRYDGDEHHGAGSDGAEAWCPERGLQYQITAGLQAEDSSLSLTLMR